MKKGTLRYYHESKNFRQDCMMFATRLGQIVNEKKPMKRYEAVWKAQRLVPRVFVADSMETFEKFKKMLDKLGSFERYRMRKAYLHMRFVPFLKRAFR